MHYLISIVVPIYKVEKYLEECLESITKQTYKNIEIILINDGSPDNSQAIAENFAEKDDRIKVINKQNGGLSDARNVGMSIATGEFICFVDSDDFIEKTMIEKALTIALENKAEIVMFSLFNDMVDEKGELINQEIIKLDCKDPHSMISTIGYAWNKLYDTSYLKSNNYQFKKGLSLVEDIVFNEKVIINAKKIVYLNEPLYHYVNRKQQTLVKMYHKDSYELHKMGFASRLNLMLKIFGESKQVKEVIANSHINGIRYCCSNMFFYNNNLSFVEKYENIKKMLNDDVTKYHIKYFKSRAFSEGIISYLVLHKFSFCLSLLYSLRAIKYKAIK